MSVRRGTTLYITAKASMLGNLMPHDIIALSHRENTPALLRKASSETSVHKAIYVNTDARAVIHAHPPYGILVSMIHDILVPPDLEGSYLLGKVPVVKLQNNIDLKEKAHIIGTVMKEHTVVLISGHGSFARGQKLEEAYMLTTSLELSAFLFYHTVHPGKTDCTFAT